MAVKFEKMEDMWVELALMASRDHDETVDGWIGWLRRTFGGLSLVSRYFWSITLVYTII